jgi:hypothetical protein
VPTTFPTTVDSFTDPISSDTLNSPTVPHHTQHANLNDAVAAMQATIFGLRLDLAASKVVPGATSFSLRNNADSADNFIVTNAGDAMLRGSLSLATAASKIVPGATSFAFRDTADARDNFMITNLGAQTSVGQPGSGSGIAGNGFTHTTGAGGGGNANGGDFTINLGVNTGAGIPGALVVNRATSTTDPLASFNYGGILVAHINANGVGAVGDGASSHPHIATDYSALQESRITLEAQTTAMTQVLYGSSTQMGLPDCLISGPGILYLRPGSESSPVIDGNKALKIRATGGTYFETWAGVTALIISNVGNFTFTKEANYTLSVADSTTGGVAGGSIILHPGAGNGAGITGSVILNSGNFVMGAAALASTVGVNIAPTWLTSVTQKGILAAPIFQTSATTQGDAIWARLQTAASAFTMASGAALRAASPSIGAGSAVTNGVGLWVENQGNALIGTSFGIFIASQSGSGTNWVFQSSAGKHRIGDATATIGFFGKTDVVQPVASADATNFVAGAGTTATSLSTWTGASGASAYTVGGIVTALKALGLLAA